MRTDDAGPFDGTVKINLKPESVVQMFAELQEADNRHRAAVAKKRMASKRELSRRKKRKLKKHRQRMARR